MGRREWNALLVRYGQKVTLIQGGEEKTLRAFFQPVAEKAPGEEPTPLGIAPRGKWLYLGPADEDLEGTAALLWEGRRFVLLRHRGFPVGEELLYRWALFEEQDEVTV